ncbi:MAG: 1-deoxy-D-xylulose-5-phosphate synthase [Spirochaetales bacterium]|nr:1-deoxy-D-xylulose-5-phosphate synthase [Spirochaetales bacterium]
MSTQMREAFGKHLAELGKTHPELVVLDADVSASTKSAIFGKAFPDRFFNVGVAEGNLAGIAAGLATAGYRPVINSFAIFLELKSIDQIRHDMCYNNLPVIIAGAYGGFSDSFDGASHQAIEDISIFRAIPNMEVIVPSDAHQAELALDYALTRNNPVYIRLNRNAMPDIDTDTEAFFQGKAVKCIEGKDITIAATGITASMACDAAKILEKEGISAEVFSCPFVKPIDSATIFESAKKTGALITVEEAVLIGGFSSALAEEAFRAGFSCKVKTIGLDNCFGETGPYIPLLAKYGLSAENIASEARKLLGK